MRIKHELLKKLRLEQGWSQREAAEQIGMDETTYRRYESGRANRGSRDTTRTKQFEILRAIAAVYNLPGPESLIEEDAEGAYSTGGVHGDIPQPPDTPFHPAWYVHRDAEERRALRRLRGPGAPVVLQGPWLYGKATLLGYLLQQAARAEHLDLAAERIVQIDVTDLDLQTFDSLLRCIARKVLQQVEPQHADEWLAAAWDRPGSEKGRLAFVLRQHVLTQGPLLLALQKAERLHGCAFQDDFFTMLRGWAESGGQEPWSRLRLVLTVATEPTLLERTDRSSFFALANPIRLGDLDRGQIMRLAELHGSCPAPDVLDRVIARVGGHPYLLRVAFYEDAVAEIASTDPGALELQQGVYSQHLRHLRAWLENNHLMAAVGALLQDTAVPMSLEDYCLLYSQGLVVEERDGTHRLRCRLYEEYFRPLCTKR